VDDTTVRTRLLRIGKRPINRACEVSQPQAPRRTSKLQGAIAQPPILCGELTPTGTEQGRFGSISLNCTRADDVGVRDYPH